jgi:hypothetical protein
MRRFSHLSIIATRKSQNQSSRIIRMTRNAKAKIRIARTKNTLKHVTCPFYGKRLDTTSISEQWLSLLS